MTVSTLLLSFCIGAVAAEEAQTAPQDILVKIDFDGLPAGKPLEKVAPGGVPLTGFQGVNVEVGKTLTIESEVGELKAGVLKMEKTGALSNAPSALLQLPQMPDGIVRLSWKFCIPKYEKGPSMPNAETILTCRLLDPNGRLFNYVSCIGGGDGSKGAIVASGAPAGAGEWVRGKAHGIVLEADLTDNVYAVSVDGAVKVAEVPFTRQGPLAYVQFDAGVGLGLQDGAFVAGLDDIQLTHGPGGKANRTLKAAGAPAAPAPQAAPQPAQAKASTVPGTVLTSWIGNTFGHGDIHPPVQAGKWVQDDMVAAAVSPEGHVFSVSIWDEAGRNTGIYKDGDVLGKLDAGGYAVAVAGDRVYAPVKPSADCKEIGIYGFAGQRTGTVAYTLSDRPFGLAVAGAKLHASLNALNKIEVIDLASGNADRTIDVPAPGAIAAGADGSLFVVSPIQRGLHDDNFWLPHPKAAPQVLRLSPDGKVADVIKGIPNWLPASLAFDPQGRLIVGDNGRSCQVLFFEVSRTPAKLVERFGQEGGIGAGTPGVVAPEKFWGITGTYTDRDGALYVIQSEDGCVIRKFSPPPQRKLVWELMNMFFVNTVSFDPDSDGEAAFGSSERFTLDLSKDEPGSEWRLAAYTYDRQADPDDPRRFHGNKNWASPFMRRVEGRLLQFTVGMYGGMMVHRFTDDKANIAVFCRGWNIAQLHSEVFPDRDGNIWFVEADKLRRIPLLFLTPRGDPVFGDAQDAADVPAEFRQLARLRYDADADALFLFGYGKDDEHINGCNGRRVACYPGFLAGNRQPAWQIANLAELTENQASCFDVDPDYLYLLGVRTRAKVWVFSRKDGSLIGTIEPGGSVGGIDATGWIDIPNGVHAFKRCNGERLIAVEEDLCSKVILYRWQPGALRANTLEIATTSIPRAIRGKPYGGPKGYRLSTRYGKTPTAWSVEGTLPPGMQLTKDGVLSGTVKPDAIGEFRFTVTAKSGGRQASRQFTVTLDAPSVPKANAPDSLTAYAGVSARLRVPAGGGNSFVSWRAPAALPKGLTVRTDLDGKSALLVGKPAQPGEFTVTLEGTDEDGDAISATVQLHVEALPAIGRKLAGTPVGAQPSYTPQTNFDKAFDGNVKTFFDGPGNGYVGVEFDEPVPVRLVRIYPRQNYQHRMLNARLQGLPEGQNDFIDLHVFDEPWFDGDHRWQDVHISEAMPLRQVRLVTTNLPCNIAEFEVYGMAGAAGRAGQ